MRKQIIDSNFTQSVATAQKWLNLEELAQVQITSEETANPIELALIGNPENPDNNGPGWLAAKPGEQTLRLLFDKPQNISLIHLQFRETEQNRTQEFLLRYSTDQGASYQEILRQQYTFSQPSSSTQIENYNVQLKGVTSLELTIIPDISGGSARASLAALQLA
jgi:hypothetical protein